MPFQTLQSLFACSSAIMLREWCCTLSRNLHRAFQFCLKNLLCDTSRSLSSQCVISVPNSHRIESTGTATSYIATCLST